MNSFILFISRPIIRFMQCEADDQFGESAGWHVKMGMED